MKDLKQFIKTTIREFINERYEINNLPNGIVLLSSKNKKDSVTLLLYDKINEKPIGYISFGYYSIIKSFTVGGAYSEHGYGPFLYESAMTYVHPNGLSMSRCGSTSFDALEVWEKFDKRNDVKKQRINSDEITHKKEDLPAGGMFDDDPETMNRIFVLEDTRFFYTFGKDKLNKLIQNGKEYMEKNNITEQDVEYMSWDLE